MKRVFVDTSAFFAHLVAEDANHRGARALFERADRETWALTTTNAVVWETYALIRVRARNGRELALGFLDDIQDGSATSSECDRPMRPEPSSCSGATPTKDIRFAMR